MQTNPRALKFKLSEIRLRVDDEGKIGPKHCRRSIDWYSPLSCYPLRRMNPIYETSGRPYLLFTRGQGRIFPVIFDANITTITTCHPCQGVGQRRESSIGFKPLRFFPIASRCSRLSPYPFPLLSSNSPVPHSQDLRKITSSYVACYTRGTPGLGCDILGASRGNVFH